jgi:hypothetical protein
VPEFREGIIEPVILDKNAMLPPFTSAGLGFEIDERRLKKYGNLRQKGLKAALELKKRKEGP